MLARAFYSWLMFPVYVWQGIRLRMKIERMLPARLPVEGVIEGKGDPVRLLVIGDSTVASVGIEELEGTFAYAIANAVHERSGRTVAWRAAGNNSASSGDLRDFVVPHVETRDWTHVVISVGTNDMKNFHAVARFKREFGTLLYALNARFPGTSIIWTPIPDMRKFPALPKGLAAVLAARADLINAKGAQLCRERSAIAAPVFPIENTDGFHRDGFHPNAEGYNAWARHLAPTILATSPVAPAVTKSGQSGVTPIKRETGS